MARSPLCRRLARALRLASLPVGADRASVERANAPGLLRPSRREALRAGGVALAGLAAARCASVVPSETPSGPDEVLVVGGGLAGLTAAYRLKQAGVAVRVLEAQERIGGGERRPTGALPGRPLAQVRAGVVDTPNRSPPRPPGRARPGPGRLPPRPPGGAPAPNG